MKSGQPGKAQRTISTTSITPGYPTQCLHDSDNRSAKPEAALMRRSDKCLQRLAQTEAKLKKKLQRGK